MARASISHIALTISDLNRSAEFYDHILNSWALCQSWFLKRLSKR